MRQGVRQQHVGSARYRACRALARSQSYGPQQTCQDLLECTEADTAESELGFQSWKQPQHPYLSRALVELKGPPGWKMRWLLTWAAKEV